MVQARDQKECLKIHYARETFQEAQQVWAAATFQSVCCVYLVHGVFFISQKYLSFEWILLRFKVAWRWKIYALVSLTPCGAAPPCNKLCLFACLCVAGVLTCVFGWRGSLALTLNICRVIHLAADVEWHRGTSAEVWVIPATYPSFRPRLHCPNRFSGVCVIFPSSPSS